MRLPIIKHITEFARERDEDFLLETIETLEALTESPAVKDEEMDVIGELLSNLYGAVEVNREIDRGLPQREALNAFMGRVVGAIDR